MSIRWGIAIVTALLPFAAVGAMAWLARVVEERRAARIARQIALTDAIHHELGAAAAPEVERSWTGEWIVAVRLPLRREATVGAVTRITHDLFRRLDGQDPPPLRLVLVPEEIPPRPPARPFGYSRPAARLGRAA